MTKYYVSPPNEAAKHLDADPLTGKDSWFTHHRFAVVASFLPRSSKQTLLDFGCGNGLFLRYLQTNKYDLSLHGYDPYFFDISTKNRDNYHFYDSLLHISPKIKFDFVTALDVIEHIEDDGRALQQINKMLTPGGTLLLTVPAYQWLYCLADAAIGHYRRYTKDSALSVLKKTGFSALHATHFFCFLIPVSVARKYYLSMRKTWRKDHNIDASIEKWSIFSTMTKIELKFMQKTNFRLPCGTSLFVVAQKIHEAR